MCDIKQTFGLVVPQLAMRSELSFDALLELCSASYKIHHNSIELAGSEMTTHTRDPTYLIEDRLAQLNTWEADLISILAATKKFLAEAPKSWEDILSKNNFLHKSYCHILETSSSNILNTRMLWLLARLGK
jgi:hypothetical protein